MRTQGPKNPRPPTAAGLPSTPQLCGQKSKRGTLDLTSMGREETGRKANQGVT